MRLLTVFTRLWAPTATIETSPMLARLRLLVDPAVFGVIIALLAIKAISEVDAVWDSLNYHLPFAARRAGLIPAEAYRFQEWLELCYQGIPALPYYLYGALWRLFGTASAANLVSVVAFAGYVLIAGRLLDAPRVIVAVALLAIPAIHVNISSSYTDLVTNLFFAGALVVATLIIVEPSRPMVGRILAMLAMAAVAANFKLQYVGIVGGFVPLFFVMLMIFRHEGRPLSASLRTELGGSPLWVKVALFALVAACYASAAKNWYFYGNPFYPITIEVFGHALPGVSDENRFHAPQYLIGTPQPFIWAASVLEYLALGWRPLPYTIGQGNVDATVESTRMGGYLAFFVLFNLAIFAMATLSRGGRHLLVLAGFVGLTIAVSLFPASHELRYYSFWMVYLVTMNIGYCWKWQAGLVHKTYFGIVAAAALAFVTTITGGGYIFLRDHYPVPRFTSIESIITLFQLQERYLPLVQDGRRYCLVNWGPYPIIGAAHFYPGRNFSVVEAEATGCPPDTEAIDFAALRAAPDAP